MKYSKYSKCNKCVTSVLGFYNVRFMIHFFLFAVVRPGKLTFER